MTHKPLSDFWVASCVPDGGAFRYRLYENGEIEQVQQIPMSSPMFLEQQDGRLWAILRAPFDHSDESGVAAYDLKTRVRLTDLVSTKGEVACHIAVDGEEVYCANYISGSVFKMPASLEVHTGHGVNPIRQEAPHVHSVFFSPDRKYVLSCDLGLDTIFVYDRNLNPISVAKVPEGAGARHLAFSKDGNYVYCVNEMSATISVFDYAEGHLIYLHDVSAKPKGFEGQGKGAAIKLSGDGKHLYVTERGSETIALFAVNGAELTLLAHFDTHGAEPRDFTLLANETYAVCTNQFGDSIALYQVDMDGKLTYVRSFALPAPLCAIEV